MKKLNDSELKKVKGGGVCNLGYSMTNCDWLALLNPNSPAYTCSGCPYLIGGGNAGGY